MVLPHDPLTMESINVDLIERLPAEVRSAAIDAGLPAGRAWLLVEMGGADPVSAQVAAEKMLEELRDSGSPATATLVTDPGAQRVLWRCRTDAAGLATRRADGAEAWGGREDAAVSPQRLAEYLRKLDELLGRRGARPAACRGAATPATAIVADGFGCRTQITHGTSRQPLHSAQVLADALRQGR